MTTNVSPANAAAIIESFARNQNCRERNLDKIVFVTEQSLEGKKIVNSQSQEPVSYQIVFDAFLDLRDKTEDVERAIANNAYISPTLDTAHQVLQARIASVAENVQTVAKQAGIAQKQDETTTTEQAVVVPSQNDQVTKQPVSRGSSVKSVALAVTGVGVLAAAGVGAYVFKDQIIENAPYAGAKLSGYAEVIGQKATELYNSVRDYFTK